MKSQIFKQVRLSQFAAAALLAAVCIVPAHGADDGIELPPGSPQSIGMNFDPNVVKGKKIQCAEPVQASDIHNNIQNATSIDISEIKSERELAQKVGFSASLNARYGIVKGQLSYDNERESDSKSSTISWVVSVKADLGTRSIDDFRLKKENAALLKKDPEAFARKCGTEVITSERKSALVYAVYTLKNATDEQKQKVNAALHLSASGMTGSVEASAEYKSLMTEINKSSNLSVQAKLVGGKGVTDAADLVPTTYDLGEFQNRVVNYLKGISIENGYSTETYSTSIFDAVGGTQPPLRVRRISEYEKARVALLDHIDQLDEIVDLSRSIKYDDMPAVKRDKFRAQRAELVAKLRALDKRAEACDKSYGKDVEKNCQEFPVELADIEMPAKGCDIPYCSKCSADNQCLVCQIKPSAGAGGVRSLAIHGSITEACSQLPPDANARIFAQGHLTNNTNSPGQGGITHWAQSLTLSAGGTDFGYMIKNNETAIRTMWFAMPMIQAKIPADGKLPVSLASHWSGGDGTEWTAVQLDPDFTITVEVDPATVVPKKLAALLKGNRPAVALLEEGDKRDAKILGGQETSSDGPAIFSPTGKVAI